MTFVVSLCCTDWFCPNLPSNLVSIRYNVSPFLLVDMGYPWLYALALRSMALRSYTMMMLVDIAYLWLYNLTLWLHSLIFASILQSAVWKCDQFVDICCLQFRYLWRDRWYLIVSYNLLSLCVIFLLMSGTPLSKFMIFSVIFAT